MKLAAVLVKHGIGLNVANMWAKRFLSIKVRTDAEIWKLR